MDDDGCLIALKSSTCSSSTVRQGNSQLIVVMVLMDIAIEQAAGRLQGQSMQIKQRTPWVTRRCLTVASLYLQPWPKPSFAQNVKEGTSGFLTKETPAIALPDHLRCTWRRGKSDWHGVSTLSRSRA
jgi:hypothetical protein